MHSDGICSFSKDGPRCIRQRLTENVHRKKKVVEDLVRYLISVNYFYFSLYPPFFLIFAFSENLIGEIIWFHQLSWLCKMTALKSYEANVLGFNFKTLANGGQFTLSTRLIIFNYPVILSHRRSTTVSLETYLLYSSLFLSVYWRDNPRENTRKVCISEPEAIDWLLFLFFFEWFPNIYVGKPIESAVCYFNNTNFNFPWIYRRDQRLFLTNQRARSILTILWNSIIIIF